jgi:Uma2 family endonuclease
MSATIQQLTAADAGLELTRTEFADAEWAEGVRFERVHGKLVVMPPAGHEHHVTVEPIRDYLGAYRLAHPDIVDHVFQESWTSVDEDTDRIPDIAVYLKSAEQPPQIPDRIPELIFDIVSPGRINRRRDYDEKRAEYERLGVLEYVIVDRFDHEVTVLRLVEGKYAEQLLKPSDTYRTPLLPGLEIPLQPIIG